MAPNTSILAVTAAQKKVEFWAKQQRLEHEAAFVRQVIVDFDVSHVLLNEWSPLSDLTAAEGVRSWLSDEREVAQLLQGEKTVDWT